MRAIEILAVALAAANVAFLVVLLIRRVWLARRLRIEAKLERRVQPLALRLVDNQPIEELSPAEQVALADVLARYARLVRGEARASIGRYFAGSPAYRRQLNSLGSRRAWTRATAAFALGDMAVAGAIGPLLGALEDPSREVRASAARSLGRLQAEAAAEPLVRQLAARRLPPIVVADALLAIGAPVIPHLRGLVSAPDGRVRASAVELLGLAGGASDATSLVAAVFDADEHVRAAAARALGRVGAQSATDALRLALQDGSSLVREAAANALGAIGDPVAVDELVELATIDGFEPARAAAVAAAQIHGRPFAGATSPHLIEVSDLAAI